MAQTCPRCSHANPDIAEFCYFDGQVLPGRGRLPHGSTAPLAEFPHPFYFPSGRACFRFDHLTRACFEDWPTAVELFQQGKLETFLDQLGRTDLASAARVARNGIDPVRGLDELLARFPGQDLPPAQLEVRPVDFNLGLVKLGEDYLLELHLVNRGLRLLTAI